MVVLLRRREPTQPDDTRTSRTRNLQHHADASQSTTQYNYSEAVGSKTWHDKLGAVFGLGGGKKARTRRGVGGGQGWIQASSGDEWDVGDDEFRRGKENERKGNERKTNDRKGNESSMAMLAPGPRTPEDTPMDEPFRPPVPFAHVESVESFATTSKDVSLMTRSDSPEGIPLSPTQREEKANRHKSSASTRTFTGGTRFLEGL